MRNPVIPLCNIASWVSCWLHPHGVVAFCWLCLFPPADSVEDAVLLPRLSRRSRLLMQTSWFQLSLFLILISDPPLQCLTVQDPYSFMFGSAWSRNTEGIREELREGLKWYKSSSYICDSATNKNVNGKRYDIDITLRNSLPLWLPEQNLNKTWPILILPWMKGEHEVPSLH